MTQDAQAWKSAFDWTQRNRDRLLAIPHVRRFGSVSKRENGAEVAGIYVGIDSFSPKIRQMVTREVQNLFGEPVWVDVHYARQRRSAERSLSCRYPPKRARTLPRLPLRIRDRRA